MTQIFQLEYQGQTRNTRILEHKPLIDIFFSFHIKKKVIRSGSKFTKH